jgi:transposase
MIPVPSGVQVWLASGHTDMRKGFDGLALLVQETLKRNPHNGHLFVFRGRRGCLIKVLCTTARACACLRSGWSVVALFGPRPPPARASNAR